MALLEPKLIVKSPSNGSLVEDEYSSPFMKQECRPKNNSVDSNPIFMSKSDLRKSTQYKIRPKSYLANNPTQFSNILIKSKVVARKDLFKEATGMKLSARTQLNPEIYEFAMKSARAVQRQKAMQYINLDRRDSNKMQMGKRPVMDQFKLLIKESQKYLRDVPHKSMKIINSSKSKIVIKTENNEPNLSDSRLSKFRKKTNPNMTHRSFFDFGEDEVKDVNNTPVVWTFGKYKTIHQRSHSFARRKVQYSRVWS